MFGWASLCYEAPKGLSEQCSMPSKKGQRHQLGVSSPPTQEAVTHACATAVWAVTLSRDRLQVWQVADWQLVRRVLGPVVATSLAVSGQLGALHHDDSGQLRWSLWAGDTLRAERVVPRGPDGRPMLCLWLGQEAFGGSKLRSQLACGEGYAARLFERHPCSQVAMAAKGGQHLLLLWRLPGAEAPQQLQLSKAVRQIAAHGPQLLALCRDELLLVAHKAVRRIAWPGVSLLAADGQKAVGLQRCQEGRLALSVQPLTRARRMLPGCQKGDRWRS